MNLTRLRAGAVALARRFWPPARKRAVPLTPQEEAWKADFMAAFERRRGCLEFPLNAPSSAPGAISYPIKGIALALLLLPSLALAQGTPVYQSGTLSKAHNLGKLTRNGQVQDVGGITGDTNGRGVNPFGILDSNDLGVCSYDAVTSGPHHRLCLGHNANGDAVLTIDAQGGAANADFLVSKNGSIVAALGNVTGPPSSTDLALTLWNGTGGTTLRDGTLTAGQSAKLTSPGPSTYGTYTTIYNAIEANMNALPRTSQYGGNTIGITQALVGANDTPATDPGGSEAFNSGVSGYSRTASQRAAVGVFGGAMLNSAITNPGSGVWQFNGIASNAPCTNPGTSCTTTSGFNFGNAIGMEADFNIVQKAGGLNPTGIVHGFLASGNFIGHPDLSVGFEVGVLGTTPWDYGFFTHDGGATVAAYIGALTANAGATTSDSQPIQFQGWSAGVSKVPSIKSLSAGDLALTLPAAGVAVQFLGPSEAAYFKLGPTTLATGVTLVSALSGNLTSLEPLEINSSQVLIDGGLTLGNVTNKGAGTINIQGTIWTNGTQGVASRTCTVNTASALTLIFTNGLLTGGTCNT